MNCYLRPDRFDSLPFEPVLHKQGAEAFLVSHQEGTLKDIPGIEKIRSLSSFRCVLCIFAYEHILQVCAFRTFLGVRVYCFIESMLSRGIYTKLMCTTKISVR